MNYITAILIIFAIFSESVLSEDLLPKCKLWYYPNPMESGIDVTIGTSELCDYPLNNDLYSDLYSDLTDYYIYSEETLFAKEWKNGLGFSKIISTDSNAVVKGELYGEDITLTNFTLVINSIFIPPKTGYYNFSINTLNMSGAAFSIDHQLEYYCCDIDINEESDIFQLVTIPDQPETDNNTGSVYLVQGFPYSLYLSYINLAGDAVLNLTMTDPDGINYDSLDDFLNIVQDSNCDDWHIKSTTTDTWTGTYTQTYSTTSTMFSNLESGLVYETIYYINIPTSTSSSSSMSSSSVSSSSMSSRITSIHSSSVEPPFLTTSEIESHSTFISSSTSDAVQLSTESVPQKSKDSTSETQSSTYSLLPSSSTGSSDILSSTRSFDIIPSNEKSTQTKTQIPLSTGVFFPTMNATISKTSVKTIKTTKLICLSSLNSYENGKITNTILNSVKESELNNVPKNEKSLTTAYLTKYSSTLKVITSCEGECTIRTSEVINNNNNNDIHRPVEIATSEHLGSTVTTTEDQTTDIIKPYITGTTSISSKLLSSVTENIQIYQNIATDQGIDIILAIISFIMIL